MSVVPAALENTAVWKAENLSILLSEWKQVEIF